MLDEEIKKTNSSKGSKKGGAFSSPVLNEDSEALDKFSDLSLRSGGGSSGGSSSNMMFPSSSKHRTPTRQPIAIAGKGGPSMGRFGSSLPAGGDFKFMSHSMPVRPIIGSLPGKYSFTLCIR